MKPPYSALEQSRQPTSARLRKHRTLAAQRAGLSIGGQLLVQDLQDAARKGMLEHQLARQSLQRYPLEARPLMAARAAAIDAHLALLPAAPVFLIDAAAAMLHRQQDGSVHLDIRTLPPIVPPYPVLWMEYADCFDPGCARAGALVVRQDWRALDAAARATLFARLQADHADLDMRRTSVGYFLSDPEVAWVLLVQPFIHSTDLALLCAGPCHFLVALRADGTPLYGSTEIHAFFRWATTQHGVDLGPEISGYNCVGASVYTTLALLHCKNVRAPETVPLPGVQKHRAQLGRTPAVTYKTLVIDVLRTASAARRAHAGDGAQERAAAHMVRGHFRTYGGTDAAGAPRGKLFGRVSGTFFFEDHVRGNPLRGTVVKDYRLAHTPEVR